MAISNFKSGVDLRQHTISELFFTQIRDLTEKTAKLDSINIQFSDALHRW